MRSTSRSAQSNWWRLQLIDCHRRTILVLQWKQWGLENCIDNFYACDPFIVFYISNTSVVFCCFAVHKAKKKVFIGFSHKLKEKVFIGCGVWSRGNGSEIFYFTTLKLLPQKWEPATIFSGDCSMVLRLP